ncbi:hypothetical protein ACH347_07245 [Saccharopolyspora sp. 5N102]|uniref:hypothetical protein n=1 Tax=Saccharopolyspora sp. 5N102 TaxID=3375155 RepID=UPI0037A695BE
MVEVLADQVQAGTQGLVSSAKPMRAVCSMSNAAPGVNMTPVCSSRRVQNS